MLKKRARFLSPLIEVDDTLIVGSSSFSCCSSSPWTSSFSSLPYGKKVKSKTWKNSTSNLKIAKCFVRRKDKIVILSHLWKIWKVKSEIWKTHAFWKNIFLFQISNFKFQISDLRFGIWTTHASTYVPSFLFLFGDIDVVDLRWRGFRVASARWHASRTPRDRWFSWDCW